MKEASKYFLQLFADEMAEAAAVEQAVSAAVPAMTWEQVMADPQLNQKLMAIFEARLRQEQPRQTEHTQTLQRQGEALKVLFPSFDLNREMCDPRFVQMTGPDMGMSVEDAFYALHHSQIQPAVMEVAAQRTAQMISDAIRSGSLRPRENGTLSQGASLSGFDPRNATDQERDALKKRIRQAAARGEKLYPGQ